MHLYEYFLKKGISEFQDCVKIRQVKKGEMIYDITQEETDFYEVKTGAIKLGTQSPKGERYIYAVLKPGETFGNTAFLSGAFMEFSKAIVPSTLYVYKLHFIKQQILNDPGAVEMYIRKITTRWNSTESLLAKLHYYEPRERILQLYKTYNEMVPTDLNRPVKLIKNLTKKDIADLTATTRQLVASTLNDLL